MLNFKILEKKKILIRIGSLRHGGAEKVLVTFLKNLPKDKYEIDLLLNLYSGKYLAEVPNWINVLYLNKGEMITTNRIQDIPKKAYRVLYQNLLKKFPKILYSTILKNKKYDVEFAAIHGMRDDILDSPIKSSKKIVWIHNDLRKTEFHNYTDQEIRKFFGFDKIMVISEHIQKDFENLAQNESEKSKIVRIHNPIDTEEILEKSDASTPLSMTKKLIIRCGSGVTACHTILALDYAGFVTLSTDRKSADEVLEVPNLYVGSWSEWSRREGKEIAREI